MAYAYFIVPICVLFHILFIQTESNDEKHLNERWEICTRNVWEICTNIAPLTNYNLQDWTLKISILACLWKLNEMENNVHSLTVNFTIHIILIDVIICRWLIYYLRFFLKTQ